MNSDLVRIGRKVPGSILCPVAQVTVEWEGDGHMDRTHGIL